MSKSLLKELLPPVIIRYITGLFYGWYGNYKDWETAGSKCSGYESAEILNKIRESALMVKNGYAAFEKDSVVFNEKYYNHPVLSGLLWIASKNNNKLNVLDFGGSLGSSYFQNRFYFDHLEEFNWNIVEQPSFVEEGRKYFSDEKLKFYYTIDDCLNENKIDIILLSSVLPYLEKPYELLESVKKTGIKYILPDKMPLIKGADRITIQKVNPRIYKATYPCWFFNSAKFLDFMKQDYDLVYEFDNPDRSNIPCEFKGFLFQFKENK